MEIWHIMVLAVVQGITEFLPISSSAHLVLVPKWAGWADQGIVVDVALHIGTLAAVVVYFRRETAAIFRGSLRVFAGDFSGTEAGLALKIALGTLPVVVAGFLLQDRVSADFRNAFLIAFTTISFGIVLWIADRGGAGRHSKLFGDITLGAALLIGLAQVLALVPGVSRSGITMTAALFLGYQREASARFSLLLSIPTIFAAGTLKGVDLWQSGNAELQLDAALAALLAFIAALVAIACLMAWLRKATFTPFVAYRLVLGGALLIWLL
jgi:undecaprenyl-diphosphatase